MCGHHTVSKQYFHSCGTTYKQHSEWMPIASCPVYNVTYYHGNIISLFYIGCLGNSSYSSYIPMHTATNDHTIQGLLTRISLYLVDQSNPVTYVLIMTHCCLYKLNPSKDYQHERECQLLNNYLLCILSSGNKEDQTNNKTRRVLVTNEQICVGTG